MSAGAQGPLSGVIANLPMFRQMAPAHFAELVRHARIRHVGKGGSIYGRNEHLPGIFAVAFGLVNLSLREDGGKEKVLRLVGPGQTFGEPPVFLERASPVSATALSDSMLVIFPEAALLSLLERDPIFARKLVANLCLRIETLVLDLEATSLHDARERVAIYLESLAQGREDETLATVHLPTTKTVIASRLGMTKETFSRLLHELVEQRLISIAKRDISLLDRLRLAATVCPNPSQNG